jgi:hypothetical protein
MVVWDVHGNVVVFGFRFSVTGVLECFTILVGLLPGPLSPPTSSVW